MRSFHLRLGGGPKHSLAPPFIVLGGGGMARLPPWIRPCNYIPIGMYRTYRHYRNCIQSLELNAIVSNCDIERFVASYNP